MDLQHILSTSESVLIAVCVGWVLLSSAVNTVVHAMPARWRDRLAANHRVAWVVHVFQVGGNQVIPALQGLVGLIRGRPYELPSKQEAVQQAEHAVDVVVEKIQEKK